VFEFILLFLQLVDCQPGQHLVSVRVASPALALVLFLIAATEFLYLYALFLSGLVSLNTLKLFKPRYPLSLQISVRTIDFFSSIEFELVESPF
jgi:hypothetical protein